LADEQNSNTSLVQSYRDTDQPLGLAVLYVSAPGVLNRLNSAFCLNTTTSAPLQCRVIA